MTQLMLDASDADPGRPFPVHGTAAAGIVAASASAASASATPDLAGLRWLARMVLVNDSARLLDDVPAPCLAGTYAERTDHRLWHYVMRWITAPDPGSAFEARTLLLRGLSGVQLYRAIRDLGYEGLIFATAETVLGHVFFQRQGNALHAFSAAVAGPFNGKGYSTFMICDYLAYAAQSSGIAKARIGRGRNNLTRRILARINNHKQALGWHVADDGWVTFTPLAT
jgi:hypothetical protein